MKCKKYYNTDNFENITNQRSQLQHDIYDFIYIKSPE